MRCASNRAGVNASRIRNVPTWERRPERSEEEYCISTLCAALDSSPSWSRKEVTTTVYPLPQLRSRLSKLHTRSKLTLHRPDQCVLLAADRYFDHTLGRQIGDADCGLHISHGDVIEAEAAGLNEPPGFAG